MIAARSKAALLMAIVALAASATAIPSSQASHPNEWFPVGPGAEATIFSKTTTEDPFVFTSEGPYELELRHVDVAPGGTTGLAMQPGTTVVAVVGGVATLVSAEAERCATRTVSAGSAVIQPGGSVTEIRNQGTDRLELYIASLTPSGVTAAGTPPPGPCQASAPGGTKARILNHSAIDGPVAAESRGVSDVYVAAARLAPRGRLMWHVQQRPLFAGVDQGPLSLHLAQNGRCQLTVHPVKTGFYEPPNVDHEVRNDTDSPGFFYVLGFSPSPQFLIAPSAPPKECEKS